MAGILNNKERIIDFIITDEGKRQAGSGEMNIKFATFTDFHTFYETSGSFSIPSLASDASSRIYFEASNRYQDVIVPEITEGIGLSTFKTKDCTIAGSQIISGSSHNIIHGSLISGTFDTVLSGITQNFVDNRIIGTNDQFSFYQDFELSDEQINFSISDSTLFFRAGNNKNRNVNIDNVPSVWNDRRFAEFPNFIYLPPVNVKLQNEKDPQPLGIYQKLNEKEIITNDELLQSLSMNQKKSIKFSKTSRYNNIMLQVFEQNITGIEKLSIVDIGEFTDAANKQYRVVYAGKIKKDSFGAETFLCLFTLILRWFWNKRLWH